MIDLERAAFERLLHDQHAQKTIGHAGCQLLLHVLHRQGRERRPGGLLTSVRRLSIDTQLSRNTVSRVLSDCQERGWLVVTAEQGQQQELQLVQVVIPAVLVAEYHRLLAEQLVEEAQFLDRLGVGEQQWIVKMTCRWLEQNAVLLARTTIVFDAFLTTLTRHVGGWLNVEPGSSAEGGSTLSRVLALGGSTLSHPWLNVEQGSYAPPPPSDDLMRLFGPENSLKTETCTNLDTDHDLLEGT